MLTLKKLFEKIEQYEQSGEKGKLRLLKILCFGLLWKREFNDNRCMQNGTSLTYTTILAIFPLLAIVALFVPVFLGGTSEVQAKALSFIGDTIVPAEGGKMKDTISTYFQAFKENRAAIGIFGIIGMLLSAVALLSSIEKSFNEIWKVYSNRSWARMFSNFTTILICVPILIGVSIGMSSQLGKITHFTGKWTAISFPFIMTCLAFTLAYYILPNTKVEIKYALISGIMAGLFWEAAKLLFRYYVANKNMEMLVKSLGSIPIFLIWIYFSWIIVLSGCLFGYVMQNFNNLFRENFRVKPKSVIDSRLIFSVFLIIADRFQKDEGSTSFGVLVKRMPLKSSQMKEIIKILISGGVVSEIESAKFLPALPLEHIYPGDILKLGCSPAEILMKGETGYPEVLEISSTLEKSMLEWGKDQTLRDYLEKR